MMWLEVLAVSCLLIGAVGVAYTILDTLLSRGDDL